MAKKIEVKCKYCGEKIDRADAFSPIKKNYYCSEEHYKLKLNKQKDSNLKKDFVSKASNICGVNFKQHDINKFIGIVKEKGYDVSMAYLEEDSKYLSKLSDDKCFEIGNLSAYLAAVIKSRLMKFELVQIVEHKIIEVEYDDVSKYKRGTKRRPLAEIEAEV